MDFNNLLIHWVELAFGEIDLEYFRTAFDISHYDQIPDSRQYKVAGEEVHRFGERIFSYELYHQMKIVLDEPLGIISKIFPDHFLQGEVKKHQIPTVLENLNLLRLQKDYIPDILYHQPGNEENALVMEIKVTQNLTPDEVHDDISKLIQFLDRYNYKVGIFIALNNEHERVKQLIRENYPQLALKRKTLQEIQSNIHIFTTEYLNKGKRITPLVNVMN